MKKLNFKLAATLLTVLLLAAFTLFSSILNDMRSMRLDLTEDKLFTLSPSAQNILSRLQVPVQVKYYVTREDKMPTQLKTLSRDVTDKLNDFSAASGGMLQFSVHDPSDDEELQKSLQQKGLQPFQVQSVERDEMALKLIWSAITINYKDKPEEILPQVVPQSLLTFEYELVSVVYRMIQDREPVIALYAPKPLMDPQMAQMYMQMGQQPPEMPDTYAITIEILGQEHYDVRRIELTEESPIPEDADALLVLGPTMLNERQAWEIQRAISRGVNTMITVQNQVYNYSFSPQGGFRITANQQPTGLEMMLASYGCYVSAEQLFDQSNQVISIPRTQNVGGMRFQTSEPVRAPMQILVTGDQMNREIPIMNRIEQLFYLWGTDIKQNPQTQVGLNLGSRMLFTSSDRTWTKPFSTEPLTSADINPTRDAIVGRLPLGVILDGQFPEPTGPSPAWPAAPGGEQSYGDPNAEPSFAGPPAPGQLILIGCGKIFEEPFVKAGQNPVLLLNAVDALALGGDLIGIRSKLITQRSIKPIESAQKVLFRLFVLLLFPVLLTLFGVIRMVARRKEAGRYQESIGTGTNR
ncbi:MAG: GldG family protein [bacterium]|nr:GldG family protein [bacterium]